MDRYLSMIAAIGLVAGFVVPDAAIAIEYPAGEPQIVAGMEIAAVYLQPIKMEPPHMMRPAGETDIHLEADIHATADNLNGFSEGDWVPYLEIDYELIGPGARRQKGHSCRWSRVTGPTTETT